MLLQLAVQALRFRYSCIEHENKTKALQDQGPSNILACLFASLTFIGPPNHFLLLTIIKRRKISLQLKKKF